MRDFADRLFVKKGKIGVKSLFLTRIWYIDRDKEHYYSPFEGYEIQSNENRSG